jgi:signal transduction histidine kinase
VNRFDKALYAAGHKSFDLPIERLIALLRIALTSFCLVVINTSPGLQPQYRAPFESILITYVVFAMGVALLPTIGKFRTGWQLPVHFIDVGVVSILTYFMEAVSAAFLILYVFVLMSATFRWNWLGALLTTVALPVLQLTFFRFDNPIAPQFMGQWTILQWGFLLMMGGVFVFFGVSRERSSETLTQIAHWPDGGLQRHIHADDYRLDASLKHVAAVLQVPRVLVLWEIAQEPYCFFALLANGKCHEERTTDGAINSFVSPELEGLAFATEATESRDCLTLQGARRIVGPIIDEPIRAKFNISSLCSAPFASNYCKGRVFMLDRSRWDSQDMTLAEIVATRLHFELEYQALSVELKETAATRERIRLARDLHDGVLQTLTGAALQLSSLASPMSKEVKQRLDGIRELLTGEQQRIREFVEAGRLSPRSECVNLDDEMQREVVRIERQWGCSATLSDAPKNAMVSLDTIRQLQYLLAEAAANAVQHGNASQFNVKVEQTLQNVQLWITDNGRGLPGITGTYNRDELVARAIGPQSIAKRVADLGGTLSLSTSGKGVELCIRLPCNSQPAQENDEQAYSVV